MSCIHIIGAGLAGVSAAVELAESGHDVQLYEATGQAGGRCRSFVDNKLGCKIDNGNHLLIRANKHALEFINKIGASGYWQSSGGYDIIDLETRKAVSIWRARNHILLSVFNTVPHEIDKILALKTTLRAVFGGTRAFVANSPLSDALLEPALTYLAVRGIKPQYSQRIDALDFPAEDKVILAVTSSDVSRLLPEISAPDEYESIINGHFVYDLPNHKNLFYGLIGGLAEWVFVKDGVISTTTSAANRYSHLPHSEIADLLWQQVQLRLGFDSVMPAHRVIVEKRATFKATSKQIKLRPNSKTCRKNVFLAGDYTQTGLPATIEGSIISGKRAAKLAIRA